MAALVNSVSAFANTAATASLTTGALAITAGNDIIVGVANYDTAGTNQDSSFTDSAGNVYTRIGTTGEAGGNIHVSIYVAKNVLGGASVTFTYTLLNTGQFPRIHVEQWSGLDTAAPADQSTFGISGAAGTALTSAALTTLQANEILIAVGADSGATGTESFADGGAAQNTGAWTLDLSNTGTGAGLSTAMAHATVAATGTYAVTQTCSAVQNARALAFVTFKVAVSALAAGTLSAGAMGATSQALSIATDTGGTAPYSNQLQQAPDNAGAPGAWANVGAPVAGATANFTASGLTPGNKYWWRVVVTDAASATATSNQVTATVPSTAITAPSPARGVANTAGYRLSLTGTGGGWTAGAAEVQSLIATGATAGTFTLSFGGQTTAAIAWNATAAAVQSALQALSSIGAGNVTCTGGPLPGTAVTITFAGTLAPGPQALITSNSAGLTGGTATVTRTTAGVAATVFSIAGMGGAVITSTTIADATHATLVITTSNVDQPGTLTISNNADVSQATFSATGSIGQQVPSRIVSRYR